MLLLTLTKHDWQLAKYYYHNMQLANSRYRSRYYLAKGTLRQIVSLISSQLVSQLVLQLVSYTVSQNVRQGVSQPNSQSILLDCNLGVISQVLIFSDRQLGRWLVRYLGRQVGSQLDSQLFRASSYIARLAVIQVDSQLQVISYAVSQLDR